MKTIAYPKAEITWVGKLDSSETGDFYIVKNTSGSYIRVSECSKKLLELMDGEHSVPDIMEKANRVYDFDLTVKQINEIINQFYIPSGLIQGEQPKKSMSSPIWLHVKLLEGGMFRTLSKPFQILFQKRIMVFIPVIAVLLSVHLLWDSGILQAFFAAEPIHANSISIMAIVLFSYLFHEFGHIVSCFYFGVVPGNIGFGMYLFRPVLFTDMSGAWALTRNQRLVTDIAGIYFQLILVLFLYILWIITGISGHTAAIVILLIFLSILMSLNPLLRYDGYWILSDLTGIPNAHPKAMQFIKNKIKKLLRFRVEEYLTYTLSPRIEFLFKIYCVFYLGMTSVLFGIGMIMFSYFFRDYEVLLSMIDGLVTAVLTVDIQAFIRSFASLAIILIIIIYLSMFAVKAFKGLLSNMKQNKSDLKEKLEVLEWNWL